MTETAVLPIEEEEEVADDEDDDTRGDLSCLLLLLDGGDSPPDSDSALDARLGKYPTNYTFLSSADTLRFQFVPVCDYQTWPYQEDTLFLSLNDTPD